MIKNVEALSVGDLQLLGEVEWVVEAAEMQDGKMQVLWRHDEERRWDEMQPGTPVVVSSVPAEPSVRMIKNASALVPGDRRVGPDNPPYEVAGVEHSGSTVVVEWTNGTAIRVREYDPNAGVLVESRPVVQDD